MSRRPKKGEVGVDADKLRGFVVTSGDDCDAARRLSRKHPALSSSMSVRLGSSLRKEVSFATLRCLRTERPKHRHLRAQPRMAAPHEFVIHIILK